MPTITGAVVDKDGAPTVGRIVRLYRRDTGALLSSGLTGGGTFAPTTLNPNDKSANITLSNGDLSFYATGSCIARSVASLGAGKWYWEVKCGVGSDLMLGVATSSAALTSYPGSDAQGWGYFGYSGSVFNNNSPQAYGTSLAQGDILGIALDMDAGTLTFEKNGVSLGVAYSGLAGKTIHAAVGAASGGTGATPVEVNFGATPMVYPAPAGHTPGFGVGSSTAPGVYSLTTSYVGEVQRVVLDDDGGVLLNDLIDRIVVS